MATNPRPIGDILASYDTWRAERDQARTQEAWHSSDVAGIDLLHELVGAVTSDRVDATCAPEPTELLVVADERTVWWELADDQLNVGNLYARAAELVAAGGRPRIEQVVVTCPLVDLDSGRLAAFLAGADDPAIATVREVTV